MEKKMAAQDAQLARLRKQLGQSKAAKKQKESLIPRPKPLGNLQAAMQLTEGKVDRRAYLNTRQQVYTTLVGLGVNVATDTFRSFSHVQLAKLISVLKKEMPIFSRYEDAWPIPDLIQSVVKNKRHHLARVSRAVDDDLVSDNDNAVNQSDNDITTQSPNAPATPGNNALDNDDDDDNDLTLPARAHFSPISPFSATTNFQWHELPNYADILAHDAQAEADSDDDADDDEARVFGGRNTSSYNRRSRVNYVDSEDENGEDGDDAMDNDGGGFEGIDVEMEDDLGVEHGDDEEDENEEGEGEQDEDGEGDEDKDSEGDEDEDEDDEEVATAKKRKALFALKDARDKKKLRV
ncbi:hypothetical protein BJ165DRAFT_1594824 [Panaeolus papilionaceus]|nr:hypothetical protein BJ165DRAFT_1594824 [Panaeolus papilionaceus]